MKRLSKCASVILAMTFVALAMAGCGHEHTWVEATCTEPKHCSECGETEGEALGHELVEATFVSPQTCSRCNETFGECKKSFVEENGIVFEELGDFHYSKVQYNKDPETGNATDWSAFDCPCNISVEETVLDGGIKMITVSLYEGLADWSFDYTSMIQTLNIFDVYTGKAMNFMETCAFSLPTKDGDVDVEIYTEQTDVENSVDIIYTYTILVPEEYCDLVFNINQSDMTTDGSGDAVKEVYDVDIPAEELDRHYFKIG